MTDPTDASSAHELQNLRKDLAHREGFEVVFKRISSTLIAIPLEQLETWVQDSLRDIGTFLGVDRVYAFLFDDTGEAIGAVFEWCAEGVEYHPHEQLIGVTVDNFPWSMSHWTRGENVYVGAPEELPEEAAPEAGACEAFHIKSYINVPLFAAGKLHGWVGLDSVVEHNVVWPEVDITMCKWVGETIISSMFRRNKERAMLDKQKQLEQEIFRRKQVEAELVRAQAKAKEANRIKSIMLANLSHELQTPLSGIVGFADVLAIQITDPGQRQMLDALNDSAMRLSDMVSSMLSLSELESKLLRLDLHETDLAACVRETVALFRPKAVNKGLAVELSGPDDARALLERSMAVACLSNILDNAIKYTNEGYIKISWGHRADDGVAFVSVADTGIGIADAHQEYIFDEFRQGSEGDTRQYEGIGLGLALAKKMAAVMKGSLQVQSKVGEGSVFTLEFRSAVSVEDARSSAG